VAARYLTLDHVIELHRRALIAFGGLDGIRSKPQLAAAVLQPQASAFGEDAYPTIPEKAAAYGFFLAESQPFLDGNKRTAAWAMVAFLDLHDCEIITSDEEELAMLFEDLGRDQLDRDDFFDWVISHARPRTPAGEIAPAESTDA